ncbi:MAG TPA: NAD(P)-dependent oxidoreductase [Alphaproteobacteria bacterium]|jgi:3-hydroxyisobutyrate dehydrogenase
MDAANLAKHTLGWIGTGRMGFPMAAKLAQGGGRVAAYNRTRAKAEPLAKYGASIAGTPAELADRDIVFTMVSTGDDLLEVTAGKNGVLSRKDRAPKIIIDASTVSEEASAELRREAAKRGAQLLAAPVSGNAKVIKAGKLSFVVSGPKAAFETARPYLEALAAGVSYVGEGELARIVKICHNMFLGIVAQSMAEITILAQKAGVPRHAFLDFLNKSVMGSTFTKYKSPAYVNLDFTTTFTPKLLRKDLDLGLAAGRALDVPLPVTTATREVLQAHIGEAMLRGGDYIEKDFATLLEHQARASGIELTPENVKVSDGLTS